MLASELYKQIYKHKDELKQGWNHYDPDIDLESNSKLNNQTCIWKSRCEKHC